MFIFKNSIMKKRKALRRRLKRWLRRPKSLKARKELLELQKFFLICFIGNTTEIERPDPSAVELFRWGMNIFATYWQKFVAWLLKWFPRVTWPIIRAFRNNAYFALSMGGLAVALWVFQEQIRQAKESTGNWLKDHIGWWLMLVLILLSIFLIMLVTDIPPIPVKKTILWLIGNISGRLRSSSGLSSEMMSEPKPPNERNKAIVFLLTTCVVLRYLLKQYKRKVFEDLPFGNLLFKVYEQYEEENPPKPIMRII